MNEQLFGYVETIVYAQPENGFTVARLKEPKKKELTVIVGILPGLQPGENVVCTGIWKSHPSHGKQFEVVEFTVQAPSDVIGIQKYLESGLVKGIGPVYAKKIVDKFGAATLEIIDRTPQRLLEVEGLGKKKLNQVKACWEAQKTIRDVIVFLRAHGASPGYAQKIFKAYGTECIAKVKENPYRLAKDVHGIGFKMADAIAQKLGFALHSPRRLAAGIEFVLWELANDGHTCFPISEFVPLAAAMLEVEAKLAEEELKALIGSNRLIEKEGMIWLTPYFAYEQGIAKDLLRLCRSGQAIRAIDTAKAVDWVQTRLSIQFAEQQRAAVIQALTDKVHIITGGPGTGKSTITNAILAVSRKLTEKIVLAAPTGRAAKRMTQITGKMALTIHALLEMDFRAGGFKRGKENPLDCDLIIIDEASMIDTPLLFHLLRAIPSRARVLFVGDIDQLPSVGAGTVLKDLIHSSVIGVTRLTEIFRQAKGSKIITNAHRINHGEFPEIYTPERSDFHFIEAESPEAVSQVILELVSNTIPKLWKFDPIEEIQVLSPMKKGVIGAETLNEALQKLLNPSDQPLYRAGRHFHRGDKVMQLRNNYDKGVFNGDIGRVREIDAVEQVMIVCFDEKEVQYEFSEIDELVLAYATSIHKYQGSECPCVVIPVHTSHFKMLHRNLLYTGVTRGKKQVYLVGTTKAVAIAVKNDEVKKRYTGLERAIVETSKTFRDESHSQLEFV
jgi:exodeoxyribonuclease V alpha subunit